MHSADVSGSLFESCCLSALRAGAGTLRSTIWAGARTHLYGQVPEQYGQVPEAHHGQVPEHYQHHLQGLTQGNNGNK